LSQPDLGGYFLVVAGLILAFVVVKEIGLLGNKKAATK